MLIGQTVYRTNCPKEKLCIGQIFIVRIVVMPRYADIIARERKIERSRKKEKYMRKRENS